LRPEVTATTSHVAADSPVTISSDDDSRENILIDLDNLPPGLTLRPESQSQRLVSQQFFLTAANATTSHVAADSPVTIRSGDDSRENVLIDLDNLPPGLTLRPEVTAASATTSHVAAAPVSLVTVSSGDDARENVLIDLDNLPPGLILRPEVTAASATTSHVAAAPVSLVTVSSGDCPRPVNLDNLPPGLTMRPPGPRRYAAMGSKRDVTGSQEADRQGP
jgi:hypothetical protein